MTAQPFGDLSALGLWGSEQIFPGTSLCCCPLSIPPMRGGRRHLAYPQEIGWEEPVSDFWSLLKRKLLILGGKFPQGSCCCRQKKYPF